jgi:sulfonate transport system permease protein
MTATQLLRAGAASGTADAVDPARRADGVDLVELRTSPAGSKRRRLRIPRAIERLAGVFVLLAVWQLASSTGMVSADTLAGPADAMRTGWHLAASGALGSAMWVSLQRVAIGLAIGVPIATILAIGAGLSRVGDDLVDSPMQMLRFLPIIGLEPLIVLWFGIGDAAKISLIVFGVAFPLYINTSASVRALDVGYLELADVVGLGRWGRIRKVVLPGALPGFLTGLRLSVAVAWLILVFVEQLNASNGIGYLMIRAQTFFQTDVIIVCLVVYALLGLVSDGLVRLVERRALRWQARR